MPDDGSDVGMGVCEGRWHGNCPLQFCPGMWKVPAGSAEKAASAVGSCTAPVVTGVTLWLTEMVVPHIHATVMLPEGSVGPGAGHSIRIHPCILAKEGLQRGGPGSRRLESWSRAFPHRPLPSPVGLSAGGHRRELGSCLLFLFGGQWPGLGDSHAGPGCELLLGVGAAPYGQTMACGTQNVVGREQEPGWSGGGCLHPQGSPLLISSSWWV